MTDATNDFVIRIPLQTFLSFDDHTKRAVFMAVLSFADNGRGECWASMRVLAKRAMVGKSTVQRQLAALEDEGYLERVGKQSVRGGWVTKWKVSHSGTVSSESVPTAGQLDTKVSHSDHLSVPPRPTKQLKETAAASNSIPKKKPNHVSDTLWEQTKDSYKKAEVRYRDKGESIGSPGGLFEKILKDEAERLQEHQALAGLMTAQELADITRANRKSETPQAYYLEAMKRGII